MWTIEKELSYHGELTERCRKELLNSEEHCATLEIRSKGLETIPKDWVDENTLEIDYAALDELWLRPANGYLKRLLSNMSEGDDRLGKLVGSERFRKRGVHLTLEERLKLRLEKLQVTIAEGKTVILLGMHTPKHFKLKKVMNAAQTDLILVSDHVWSSLGYIERGVKASDNILSILQAVETLRRLPELGLKGEAIKKRGIAFNLDGFDVKRGLAAIYSNPNVIARSRRKPQIKGFSHFDFAYTGLTDLELANIVRNKDWFDLMSFHCTGSDGSVEELTKEQVAAEYGIKYIGDLMVDRIRSRRHQ